MEKCIKIEGNAMFITGAAYDAVLTNDPFSKEEEWHVRRLPIGIRDLPTIVYRAKTAEEAAAQVYDMSLYAAVLRTNNAYNHIGYGLNDDMWCDIYEVLLEDYSEVFMCSPSWFEDLCTDTRWYGWDCS